MPVKHRIEFTQVTYTYPGAPKQALTRIDLMVEARTTAGIVGATGAGKTTVVDILMGLLTPDSGELRVDGVRIDPSNIRSWQANIGYVPQQIYLCDDTVYRNIAFGVPDEEIDAESVERAAKMGNIHDFITQEMKDGYQTLIGERGIRLSGGQRQRMGIARALYHDPSVIVLDEATSALDTLTENAVMEAIHNLAHHKTIVLIAHRFSTVRQCDTIFMFRSGRLIGQGRYEELEKTNIHFSQMAKAFAG